MSKTSYRAVWISDTHLGSRGCKDQLLLSFLKEVKCEYLYLVGDIVDMELLRSRWFWPQAHNDVVQRILKMAKNGTKVVYVPGNHDKWLREYTGHTFGNVALESSAEHICANGYKLFVVHGDKYDSIVNKSSLLSSVGSKLYNLLMSLDRLIGRIVPARRHKPISIARYAKRNVKLICTFIGHYERKVMDALEESGCDGIVCGHIHKPEINTETGYYNCGDWIDSCTALVELNDGALTLVDYG